MIKMNTLFAQSYDPEGLALTKGCVGVLLSCGAVYSMLSVVRKWRLREKLVHPRQVPRELASPKEQAQNEAKLFYGVRVIEIATHVAAPTAGRCMADLGAEVIKVEQPTGDFLRNFLLTLEKPRSFSTWFEHTNCGKYSLKLDLKSSACREQLKVLLRDADVVICNIREDSIKRLGFDYESLRKEFPHIIYAHLSAWGKHGELASKGGFDIGAFWSFSGMAAMTMEKERFRYYAGGSGDLTTGQMLLSGINMALYQRLKTGLGSKVEVSLMHVGAWCISPFIVRDQYQNVSDQQPPNYQNKPQASIVDTFYETRDRKHVAVCFEGSFLDERTATCEMYVALGLSCGEPAGTRFHDKSTVQRVVSTLTLEELQRKLKSSSLLRVHPYVGVKDKWEQIKSEVFSRNGKTAPVVDEVSALGVTDLPFLPRLPYEFSCSGNHGPVRRAPQMAEHTDCILQNGWLAAPNAAPLLPAQPQQCTTGSLERLPLEGVVVIEMADLLTKHDVCIPAVAAMLADKGATVYRYEPSTGDPLKSVDSDTYSLFNGEKAVIELSDVPSLLEMADVVLTDFSLEKLMELGLDYATVSANHSSIVYVHLKDGRDRSAVGALASGYVRSGYANIYAGSTAVDIPTLPTHTLELMSSAFIFASTTAALFRQRRLQSVGQEVIVTYERLGLFILQGISVLMLRDPSIIRLLGNKMSSDNPHPVPSLVAHRTKDGMWIQLLETDFKKGIMSLANALEIKHRLLRAVAWGVSVGVIPKYIQSSNALPVDELAAPAFVAINGLVKSCIAEYDYSDIKKRFEEHNLSYTTVKMPAQLINCDQYHANGVLKETTFKKLPHRKHYHVTVPVSVSDV